MKTYFHFCVFFLTATPSLTCSAQTEIVINEWGKAHGIESTIIFGVFQDANHLIWICTYNGLYYFDGFRAYKATILDADSNTPFEGIVNQLIQTPNGKYWLKLEHRLGSYDIYTNQFIQIKGAESHFLSFFMENGNDLIVVEPQKTFLVNQNANSLLPLVFLDSMGIPTGNMVSVLGNSGKYYSFQDGFPVEIVPSEIPGHFIKPIETDSAFTFWNENGYLKHSEDVHGNSWYKHPREHKWMILDAAGKDISKEIATYFNGLDIYFLLTQPTFSWFATNKGLAIWEKGADQPRYLFDEFLDILTKTDFNNFDSGKTMWNWNRNGILHIRVNPSDFSSLTKNQSGLFSDFILGMYPFDENNMLIRHDFQDKHYSILDNNTKDIIKIHEDEIVKDYGFSPYINNAKHGNAKSWIVKHGEKIHNLPKVSHTRNPFTSPTFISDGQKFKYVLYPEDHEGRALKLWNTLTDKLVFPKIDPLLLSNQGDTVWIGTESVGLVALHTPSGKTAQWLPNPADPSSIPSNRVHVVIPVPDGNLWLGTGKGLSYFDKKDGDFTTLTTKNGLIDDRIYCMVVDKKGLLWIGTGKGISRFDFNTKTFTNFTKADGLINSEYNRNSAILLDDGTILMGGMEGIDLFDPEKIEEQLEKPKPFIAHIHNNDKLINQKSEVDFGYEQNHLDFYVSADPIWMASTLTYQYKLDGADTDWESLNYSNVVHYPNLPPGNYRFQVKIANQPEIATYEFQIFPIWYRAWWFKVSYVLSSLLFFYLLYRMLLARHLYHLNQEKKVLALKAEQALSITKERERIIADLHDDVGATLSSLHIYGDLAGKVWDEQPERAKDMVGKIKAQSKDLMERMNDIVWSMKEQEKDSLSARVRLYATDLLSSKGIYFSDSISPEVEALIREQDMRRSFLLIIKEALNNIAKHSQATEVSLKVYQKKTDLIVKIKDNGRGMDLSITKNGNGLGNIKHRCTKMNGKFTIKSQLGSGTTLTCRVPLATISIAPGTNSA